MVKPSSVFCQGIVFDPFLKYSVGVTISRNPAHTLPTPSRVDPLLYFCNFFTHTNSLVGSQSVHSLSSPLSSVPDPLRIT